MKPAEEKLLRDNIRSLIKFVKQKRLNEEKELRGIIRSLIDHEVKQLNEVSTPDNDPTPNKSTGINVLEDLLKKIVFTKDTSEDKEGLLNEDQIKDLGK